MDSIDLPIKPRFDPSELDRGIAKLKELEAKGFTIPINFRSNLEAMKADAEALVTRLKGQWQGLASDFSSGNAKLLSELDRLGESTAAARLRAGFASVREEVLVLDNLISQLSLKGDPGAGLAKGLAAGRIADLVKSGRAAGDTVSFAGFGEQAERAATAQERFVAAEVKGVQTAAQSEAALAAETAALKAKAFQFEEARAAAQRFQRAEAEQTAQTAKSGGGTGADVALQRQRSAALIRNASSDQALQRQRSAAYLAEQKRVAAEETAEIKRQQSAADALQRQRSANLIRQAKEEERAAASSGFKGILNTVGTAGTFIATYGAIDVAVRALKAGAESSVEFERKLATLSVIFRGTKEEARELAIATVGVASSFGQDGIAALEVAKDFARFGGSQAEVLEAVRVVSMAANVAELELAETSKYFQAIMAGGELQAGQLAAVLGMLNTISNTYNVTVKQLLEGLARVAPLAKQAGIGLAELAGFEAVISGRTSRPGAEAGNAIKSLISRLAKPEIQGALENVGINVKDQTGELKTASTIINELFLAYQRLGSAEREELLIKVAGTMQAARIAALLDGYITSQELAIRASRDLTSWDRENMAVRQSLASQLGTLRTRWQEFWMAGTGAGQATGVQGAITDTTKLLSNLLSGLTQLERGLGAVASAGGNAVGKGLGGGENAKEATTLISSLLRGGLPVGHAMDKIAGAVSEAFPQTFKTDAERAAEALAKFNSQVEKLQKLGEADEAASRLIKTIATLVNTAPTEKLEAMFRAVAAVAAPGDLPGQEAIRAELNGLKESGDYLRINARLIELARAAEADRLKQLSAANVILNGQIEKETAHLALLQKQRDAAAKKNDRGGADSLSQQIEQSEAALNALRSRQSGNFAQQFPEGEDQWKAAGMDLDAAKKSASELVKILTERPKTTQVGDLDKEADAARLLAGLEMRKVNAALSSGAVTAEMARQATEEIEKERDATLDLIQARRQYASIIDTQKQATRRIKDQTDAYAEATKAIPSVNRVDEVAADRQVLQIKDDMLRLERAREEPMLRALGLGQVEIDIALKNIDAQREALSIEKEKLAVQERFAAMADAAKKGVKDAQATNEFFGVGQNESEKRANLIRGLTDRRSLRDNLTGLPLNITAAKQDFAGASDQIEKARALARLKEMAISLQDAENDLVKRRYQLEAEITNERRKQAQEASKNLLMADRENQLRAALAAKFAQGRGGRGFTAEEFGFFDTKTKQTIEKTNPDLLPPEFQTRLRELQDESTGLANAFRPLKEAADAAAAAIAQLRLPTPAINPGNPSAAVSIDVSPVSAAIANSGHGVQTAIDVLGTNMVRQLDSITAALDMVSVNLGTRVTRLEAGSLTSQIGRAQGAASVLA